MIRSRLFLKLFTGTVAIIALFSLALYDFSVPLIKQSGFEREERAGRAVLNTVFELANRIHLNLETYRELVLDAHKLRLKNIVEIVSGYIDALGRKVERGELTPEQARRELYTTLRQFHYGNNDYVYITDYQGTLVSHPDPEFHGSPTLEVEADGRPVLPTIVSIARDQGEGYYSYAWRRLGDTQSIPKIAYFKDFPAWGFVVATGVYLDDVEQDVQARKAAAVEDLRLALRDITIGRTGYLYIFDSSYRMIIHPNPNIEGTYFGELVDPIDNQPIGPELAKLADTGRGRFYKWDRPDDPGHYVYDKISWVRHFRAFDWYIASSVYVDELQESSEAVGDRILWVSLSFLLLSVGLSYLFARRITQPINRLAITAKRVRQGDLSARSRIVRNDEIGLLSSAFDHMVGRLRHNIDNLDATVQDRTRQLTDANRELVQTVGQLESLQHNLALTEQRQRIILDAIPALVAQLDDAGRIQFINRPYAELFESDKAALLGRSLPVLAGWDRDPALEGQLRAARTGQGAAFDSRWQGTRGEWHQFRTRIIPCHTPDAPRTDLLVLTLDVTEEKETEKRLLGIQRMNAVAQLAAGLAHDFNNLLSIILGNLVSASERYAHLPDMDDYLGPAIRASRRGADIMGRLLAFARSQPLEPRAVEVGELLPRTMSLIQRSLPGNITMTFTKGDRLHWAFADPGQLENAIINLALNARDAMPRGGRLELGLERRRIDATGQDRETVQPGEYIQIRVTDTGQGFSPEALERAFEPFFTTKSAGQGSGLGLSMVFGFAKQSRGHLAIQSRPGQGATVTLLLPAASAQQRDPLEVPGEPPCPGGDWSGRIAILVEDDKALRDTVRRQLVELGFSTLECANGDEAAQLFPYVEDLALMVSDIHMPGTLNGFELAERVLALKPATWLVLITGYVAEEIPSGHNPGKLVVLRKPFDKPALAEAIRRASSMRPDYNNRTPPP